MLSPEDAIESHAHWLQGAEHSYRWILPAFTISVICHIAIVAILMFASVYIPRPPAKNFSPSVITVDMISLSADTDAPPEMMADAVTAEPEPEIAAPEITETSADNQEDVVIEPEIPEEQINDPEPEPEIAEETPAEPEVPREQVVIPDEPKKPDELEKKPEPETPVVKKATPKKIEKTEPIKHKSPHKQAVKTKKAKTESKKLVTSKPKSKSAGGAPKDAIERIRRSVKTAKSSKRAGSPDGVIGGSEFGVAGGTGRSGAQDNAAIRFYRENIIPDRINKNWAFSENLTRRRFNLEAILVIKIMPGGEIRDVWFERKSGDNYFDDSVYRAVMKSNPLPPLPKGYGPYEVGLRFTPSGMR